MGKENPDKPPEVREAERSFGGCPGGHRLPHHTERGDCTPLWCAAGKKRRADKATAKTVRRSPHTRPHPEREGKGSASEGGAETTGDEGRRSAPSGRPAEGEAGTDVALARTSRASGRDGVEAVEETERAQEAVRMARGKGRHAARMAVMEVPPGLEGTAAEDWADKRLLSLLPLAVAEVEAQLKFGDASQRERAADKVMAATGRGKREAAHNSAPTIIYIAQGEGGSGRVAVPWSQNKSRTASAVEATVVVAPALPAGGSQGLKPSEGSSAKPDGESRG